MLIRTKPLALVGAMAIMAPCDAQETIFFRVARAVTPAEPMVQVEMWAAFSPTDHAFAEAQFEVRAGAGTFSRAGCSLECGPVSPKCEGPVVRQIWTGQLHFPPPIMADTSNPIEIAWSEWKPESFDPRDVSLDTTTSRFWVYISPSTAVSESRMATFTEGSGVIRVRRCYTDCDGTDTIDFADLLCFQNAFATDDFYADCDVSGALDFFDFLCFQNEFIAGCP